MSAIQLDFFKSTHEVEIESLMKEVSKLRISLDKQRKKLFAQHGEHEKIIQDLSDRLFLLERNICLGNVQNIQEFFKNRGICLKVDKANIEEIQEINTIREKIVNFINDSGVSLDIVIAAIKSIIVQVYAESGCCKEIMLNNMSKNFEMYKEDRNRLKNEK